MIVFLEVVVVFCMCNVLLRRTQSAASLKLAGAASFAKGFSTIGACVRACVWVVALTQKSPLCFLLMSSDDMTSAFVDGILPCVHLASLCSKDIDLRAVNTPVRDPSSLSLAHLCMRARARVIVMLILCVFVTICRPNPKQIARKTSTCILVSVCECCCFVKLWWHHNTGSVNQCAGSARAVGATFDRSVNKGALCEAKSDMVLLCLWQNIKCGVSQRFVREPSIRNDLANEARVKVRKS